MVDCRAKQKFTPWSYHDVLLAFNNPQGHFGVIQSSWEILQFKSVPSVNEMKDVSETVEIACVKLNMWFDNSQFG